MVGVEAEVVVQHAEEVDSRLRREPLAPRLAQPPPARRLGQVLAALPLVLDLRVVLQPVPGRQAALLVGRWRKVALAQAPAVRQRKVLPRHSVQPEQLQTSQAAVQRPAR